jgi:energy-coupling factor transporter transmembrane protein EcfT
MKRISSTSTLFFVLFVPVFWFVLFGSLGIGLLLTDSDEFSLMNGGLLKLVYWILFVFFALLIRFTLLRLKRVEMDGEYVYITNYFKTIRVPRSEIGGLSAKYIPMRLLARLTLSYKSYFGDTIYFICDQEHFDWMKAELKSESGDPS